MKTKLIEIADMHVHSTFSFDGISTMEEHCKEAIKKGISRICFTEHMDFNKASYNLNTTQDNTTYSCNPVEYFDEVKRLKEIYTDLDILTGMEFSEPHLFNEEFRSLSKLAYDNIIASIHHCYNSIFPGAANILKEQAVYEYYDLMIKTIQNCEFQTLGHFDFPRRYYDSWNYNEKTVNTILNLLVEKNITLEINTSTLNNYSNEPMPSLSVIEQYVKLGGTQVVLSSDAHTKERLAYGFGKMIEILPKKIEIGYIKEKCFVPIIKI